MTMRGNVLSVTVLLLLLQTWCSSAQMAVEPVAADASCASLTSGHGATPQQADVPFIVTPLQSVVESGGRLTVRLSSLQGNSLKGFLMQAHDANSTLSQPIPLGRFIPSNGSKLVSCPPGIDNSIRLGDDETTKDQMEMIWLAPSNFTGEVIFRATFVKEFSTYSVDVPSGQKVRVQRSVASTRAQLTKLLPVYDGCGQTKNCFGFPDNCQSSGNCNALVSFIRKGLVFEFELFGKAMGSDKSYVAVGFSKDPEMGQDSVNECVYYNNQMNIYTSYNNELKHNQRQTDANIITVLDKRYENGSLYCKFTRQASYSFDGLTFNLSQPHFLLLARGNAEQDKISYHDERVASSISWDLGTLTTTTASNVVPTTTVKTSTFGVPPGDNLGVYEGCGETKNCFGIPNNCHENLQCSSLVTYVLNGSDYTFELFGQLVGTSSYVAVGFSKDGEMGEDSVNECAFAGGQVNVYTSQNYDRPKSNKRISDNIVNVLAAEHRNGNLYCKFTRRELFTYGGITYNLSQPHFLLLARGTASLSNVGPHQQEARTSSAISIGEIGEVHAGGEGLMKAHGILMICSWILSASIGILLARYFRQTWAGKQIGGKDLWFVFHRILMIIVWTLTLISFIIIFVEVDGWTETATYNPHAIIGCVTTGLAFIQPFMAYFRPHPGTPRRPIFNWAHWTVGNSAHILGIACIFLAVDLPSAGLPEWMRWVLVAYVAFHAAVHLILTIHQWQNSKKSSQKSSVFPMKELDVNGHGNAADTKKQDAPGSVLRRSLLGVYVIVVSGLAAALIAAVVMAPW